MQNPNEIVLFDLTQPEDRDPDDPELRRHAAADRLHPGARAPGGPEAALAHRDRHRPDDARFSITPSTRLRLRRSRCPSRAGRRPNQITTAGLAVDGRSTDPEDARFAVWASDNTNVFTLQLVPPTTDLRNDFTPTINLTDVGGIPSEVAFVETEDPTSASGVALQVAALVPSTSSAVLVDPDTSLTTTVSLPAPYADLVARHRAGRERRRRQRRGSPLERGLGRSVGRRALDADPFGHAAVRQHQHAGRDAARLRDVRRPRAERAPQGPPDGERRRLLRPRSLRPAPPRRSTPRRRRPSRSRRTGCASGPSTMAALDLAAIDFATLNPVPLTTDLPIDGVYDVAGADGRRSAHRHSRSGRRGGDGLRRDDSRDGDVASRRSAAAGGPMRTRTILFLVFLSSSG